MVTMGKRGEMFTLPGSDCVREMGSLNGIARAGWLRRAGRGAAQTLTRDWHALSLRARGIVAGGAALPSPGLHTYRYQSSDGTLRLHLRSESDHTGVLFVDVTEVVHLSPSACAIAHLVLEGCDPETIPHQLAGAFSGVSVKKFAADSQSISRMIAAFVNATNGCRTRAREEHVVSTKEHPLFSTSTSAPYKADLAITYTCNNGCSHCYNEPDRFELESLTLIDWERVIDRLVAVGVPHLILTGGEATLHPNLPQIIRYADAAGPVVGLNTNGRRLSHQSYADELQSAGLNHVQVTLESYSPEVHNAMVAASAWKQTVTGIENALHVGLHTITNTTLTQRTVDHVEDTIDFLHGIGIRTFAMNGMIHSGGGHCNPDAIPEQQLPPILVRVRDKAAELGMKFLWYTPTEYCRMSPVELEIGAKRCNAAEYSICIEPNGDVLPCQSYYISGGNLLREPWDAIWNSDLFRSFRNRVQRPTEFGLPEECCDCSDLQLCGGGCRIEREARAGNSPSSSCSCCSSRPGRTPQLSLIGEPR